MGMRPLLALVVVLTTLLVGCPKPPDAPGPAPINVPDTDVCAAMCEHLGPKGLNCEEGQPVYNSDLPGPTGVPNQSCESFCRETQINGLFLNPKCLKSVPSCDLIEDWRKKTCTG
jgi:nitrous oxide reductase accessory protein NosL